jgi:hypothetical protein
MIAVHLLAALFMAENLPVNLQTLTCRRTALAKTSPVYLVVCNTARVFLCGAMQGTIAGNWSPYDKQNDRRGIAGVVGPAYGNIVA